MINARPHRNGSTPDHFKSASRDLMTAGAALLEAHRSLVLDVFHGRNYQHLPPVDQDGERDLDMRLLTQLQQANKLIEDLAIAVHRAALSN
jgi:hypothetical protein